MLLEKSKTHWDDMADLDPCWAILSEPAAKFGRWDLEAFFATGQREIERMLQVGLRLRAPLARDRALDFGCGLGRLTFALAHHFRRVVGIDISESMVRQANTLNRCANCTFVASISEDLPFDSDAFDLIYTAIVLQHVPRKKLVRHYIAEFLRTLKPGGLLVMQIPCYIPLRNRVQARPRLYSWLRAMGVPARALYQHLQLHPIPMTFLPERDVLKTLDENGGRILEAVPDDRAAKHISSRTYFVTKVWPRNCAEIKVSTHQR